MAMMTPQGDFVEVGDLGMAMDRQLSRALFKLMDFKTQEEEKAIYVKPFVVVEVEFTTTYHAKQAVLRFNVTRYVRVATAEFFSLREPRFKRFRQDKKAEPKDIPASQLFGCSSPHYLCQQQ